MLIHATCEKTCKNKGDRELPLILNDVPNAEKGDMSSLRRKSKPLGSSTYRSDKNGFERNMFVTFTHFHTNNNLKHVEICYVDDIVHTYVLFGVIHIIKMLNLLLLSNANTKSICLANYEHDNTLCTCLNAYTCSIVG